jgi:hypothetical protein
MSLSNVYKISDSKTIYLSKENDSDIMSHLKGIKYQDYDVETVDKHITENYTEYTIRGLPAYTKLYVHKNLITKGDVESVIGNINLEEANKLLGCHEIDTQDKSTVTMSEKAMCVSSGGRKSRKQRRSKRRRRRGRQSRK